VNLVDSDEEFRQFAGRFLRAASTGVDRLDVVRQPVTEDDLGRSIPPAIIREMRDKTRQTGAEAMVLIGEGEMLALGPGEANRPYLIQIQAMHDRAVTGGAALPIADESDGTRRLLDLLPTLYNAPTGGKVFAIDEIDRSLHPLLVRKYFDFLLNESGVSNSQIIATTHESTLLDQDLLRRDAVWFVEKDASEMTRLYPLLEFKVRKDLELRKNYLEGRFGATPIFSQFPTAADGEPKP
jgi:AAA15 family ATPase/GTPase